MDNLWVLSLLVILLITIIIMLNLMRIKNYATSTFDKLYDMKVSFIIDEIFTSIQTLKSNIYYHLNIRTSRAWTSFIYWVIILSFSYFSLFFLLPSLFGGFNILEKFGLNLVFLRDILNYSISVLSIILSISITFFLFSYRQEKGFSISLVHIPNRFKKLSYLIALLTLTLIYLVSLKFQLLLDGAGNEVIINTLTYRENAFKFDIVSILLLFCLYNTYSTYWHLYSNTKVSNLIQYLDRQNSNLYKRLLFLSLGKDDNDWKSRRVSKAYDQASYQTEATFQMLLTLASNKMDNDFKKSLKSWINNRVRFLVNDPVHIKFNRQQVYIRLATIHGDKFVALYNNIINDYCSLIISLYKNEKTELANYCFESIYKMKPSFNYTNELDSRVIQHMKNIEDYYFLSLEGIAVYYYFNKNQPDVKILPYIEKMAKRPNLGDREFGGYTSLLFSLLRMSIEKGDLKGTITLSNILGKISNKSWDNTLKQDEAKFKIRIQLGKDSKINERNKLSAFLLLMSLLKSIEQSRNANTGYIVKYLSNNINYKVLTSTFKDFIGYINKNLLPEYIEKFEYDSAVNNSFSFNKKTKNYCLKKMTILLYGQLYYINHAEIDIGKDETQRHSIEIDLSPIKPIELKYLDHLFSILKFDSKEYKLIFLCEDKMIEVMKQHLLWEIRPY